MPVYGSIKRLDGSESFTLAEELRITRNNFKNDLRIIAQVNKVIGRSIEEYYDQKMNQLEASSQKFKGKAKKELEAFRAFNRDGKNSTNRVFEFTTKQVSNYNFEFTRNFIYSNRVPMFVREMGLVYLLAEFEAYLATTLKIVFSSNTSSLKSKKTATYEFILNHGTLDGLVNSLIEEEMYALFFKDIDDINDYIQTRFNLDLSKEAEWSKFKECFYRRNIVIHNNAYPNRVYREKTGYHGPQSRLGVTKTYLSQTIRLFEQYSDHITKFFSEKFETDNNKLLNQ